MGATEWSELHVSGLPAGTVTLLLADIEGSTRLWETQRSRCSGPRWLRSGCASESMPVRFSCATSATEVDIGPFTHF
jgi:hypothetical protein